MMKKGGEYINYHFQKFLWINKFTILFSGAPFLRVRQKWAVGLIDKMTTDISVVRGGWDPTLQQEIVDEYEYDGGNSSSRLFERSRIKALAGTELCRFFLFQTLYSHIFYYMYVVIFYVFYNYFFIKSIVPFVLINSIIDI